MDWLEPLRQLAEHFRTEIIYFSYGILALGMFQNIIYFIQIPLAAGELLRMKLRQEEEHSWWLMHSDITLPISIIIPAYNEEVTIINTATASLATKYPVYEVIIVNDGSKDNTLQVLIDQFQLSQSYRLYESPLVHKPIRGIYTSPDYPNLVVVDKENGGRSDALNTGIDISRYPLFCTLDADSLLDPTALLKTVQPFIDEPEKIVATGGTVRILNGCDVDNAIIRQVRLPKKLLPLFQVVEYIRAFLMGRLAWSRLGILTIISGAFSVFRRDIALAVGGFDPKTIGEDFELVMRIHKYCREQKREYEMRFVPEPVCWTEVPETMDVLSSQRIRWQQGGLEVIFRHIEMFMNPRYGRIGLVAYPLMFIFDVVGPLLELAGYLLLPLFYLLGALNIEFMVAFLCLFFVFGIFISTMSLAMEEISLKRFSHARGLLILGFVAIIENFGYRQYNNIWRIIGWWRFLRKKQSWGEMKRVGIKNTS
ncbi:MAG: glycosyltransferase family 2 protein [Hyphomicrobiales bacterium]|nr:glycosyltransferase family 2 protein [Rickettsiales bacterium]MCP5361152.1 glycosyltransferase family 2 protein [Hyphomicrobiales bacterium]